GFLSDKQRDADVREAQKPIPRKLSIPISAAPEHVGGVFHLAEQAIKGEMAQYATTVPLTIMGHLIEKLAVELWAFSQRKTVKDVLKEKAHAGTNLEQEFAKKALFFYDFYRRPNEHPTGVPRCGAYEGPLFFYAMRALDDLAKRIIAERGTAKS